MEFLALAQISQELAATRSRRVKVQHLSSLLRKLEPSEVAAAVALISGEPRQGKVGIGGALLRRSFEVAPAANASVSIGEVDALLQRFSETEGKGSAKEREALLGGLFARLTEIERDFFARASTGELRQGALEALVLEGVADATSIPIARLRRALLFSGHVGAVAEAALRGGEAALAGFSLQLFRPLRPMLADSAGSVEEAASKILPAAIEYKLDGARIQVHRRGSDVAVFSREGHDVSARVPELVDSVRSLPAGDLVLDGEAIALAADGRPLPFQTTMQRFGRQKNVEALRASIPLSQLYFDCLYLDGDLLIDRPNAERFAALSEHVGPALVIPRRVVDTVEGAQAFVDEALAQGHEGVLVKSLDAAYDAGRRGSSWLKLKPVHTLDLVVLAVEWGNGRRQGFLSNIHLGARDPERGGFVMLGKTFKGMTDEMLAWQTQTFSRIALDRSSYVVPLRPEIVVEIAFDGIQESSQYPGGLSLRFARVRRYRPDKTADQADTIQQVRAIYERSRGARTG